MRKKRGKEKCNSSSLMKSGGIISSGWELCQCLINESRPFCWPKPPHSLGLSDNIYKYTIKSSVAKPGLLKGNSLCSRGGWCNGEQPLCLLDGHWWMKPASLNICQASTIRLSALQANLIPNLTASPKGRFYLSFLANEKTQSDILQTLRRVPQHMGIGVGMHVNFDFEPGV